MKNSTIHYGDHLQLDKILGAQQPESFRPEPVAGT